MIDVLLLLLVFAVIPAGILYLGYRKFKKKLIDTTTEAVFNSLPDPEARILLHGHDLAKWNYLGYTRCCYVDEDGRTISDHPVFMFADKNNTKRRSYHIANDPIGRVDKDHGFINKYIKTWAAGEGEVYYRVQGEHSAPSDYLKEYMLEHYSAVWDNETNWWGTNDKAKYDSAKTKQKRKQKTEEDKPEVKVEDNVVTVEFGKQA